jgi:hypothetical protein
MKAFEALEEISKLGKIEGEVDVGDIKLLMGTLDTEQETDVFAQCADLTGNAYFYKLKLETVKYSLKAVNKERVDDYLKIAKIEEREKAKKETLEKISSILKKWDENVISYLYSEWSKLAKKSEEVLKAKGISQDNEDVQKTSEK